MNNQKLEQALERIELQTKANWYDCLMYFLLILGFFIFKSMAQFLIYLVVVFIFVQFFEGREYKKVEEKYGRRN